MKGRVIRGYDSLHLRVEKLGDDDFDVLYSPGDKWDCHEWNGVKLLYFGHSASHAYAALEAARNILEELRK